MLLGLITWKKNSYYPILNPAYINIHDHCLSRYYICRRIYAIEHLLFIALRVLIKPRIVSLLGISPIPCELFSLISLGETQADKNKPCGIELEALMYLMILNTYTYIRS